MFVNFAQLPVFDRVLRPMTLDERAANPAKLVEDETHVVKRHPRNLNWLAGIISHAIWENCVKAKW